MIDTQDPQKVWREVCASERKLETEMASHKDILRRYHGGFYKGKTGNPLELENHGYMWMAAVKAQLLAANPRWNARARRDMSTDIAVAYAHALDRVTVETGLYRTLDKLFVDWGFRRCAAVIESKPGWKGKVAMGDRGTRNGEWYYPFISRLDLDRLHYDSLAREWEDTEFRGHRSLMSRDRLMNLPGRGWRRDVIAALATDSDVDGLRAENAKGGAHDLTRDDIVVYSEWFPEEQQEGYSEEEGWFGTIRLYAYAPVEVGKRAKSVLAQMKDGDGSFVLIRDPQPYFGCKGGPYLMWGQDYVPGHVEPLSQFVAMEQKLRSLNVRAAVMQRAMEAYKRLLIIAARGKQTAAKIQSGKHDHVLALDGFKKEDIVAAEVGGPTDQMLKMFMYDTDTLNQITGMTDAYKGNVTGDATATENAIAAGGASARMARLRSAWETGVAELGRAMASHMFYDDEFAVELPPEAAQQLGLKEPYLIGGPEKGQKFEDLDIDIMPKSMSFPNESQEAARSMEDLEIYMTVGGAMIASPHMDWEKILQDVGQARGNPRMSKNANYQMAEQLAGLQIGMQVQSASTEAKAKTELASTSPKTRGGGGAAKPASAIGGGGGAAKPGTLPGTQSGQKARRGAGASK